MILAVLIAVQQGAASMPPPLLLGEVVERAVAAHPAVGASKALRDRVRTDVADARSAQRPRVSVDGSLNRFEEPMVVAPLHGFDPRTPPLFDRSLVQAGVSASWVVYDFGVRAARVRATGLAADAADASVRTAEQGILAQSVGAYSRVAVLRTVLGAHDQRLAALSAARSRVQQLLVEGKAARIDVLRLDAEHSRATADRIATASQLAAAEEDLALLADIAIARVRGATLADMRARVEPARDDTSRTARDAFVELASLRSSEIEELTRRLEASHLALTATRAVRWPELRATGAWMDRGRVKGDFSAEWQLGMAVSYAAYTGGARKASVERAAAEERLAREQLRQAQLTVAGAIDRAVSALREARARASALEAAETQSAEVVRIERLAIEVGSGTQTQYLDAESALLRVRASLAEARNAELTARVELARVTGELTREWIARTLETVQ